jgi:hypothetical protein
MTEWYRSPDGRWRHTEPTRLPSYSYPNIYREPAGPPDDPAKAAGRKRLLEGEYRGWSEFARRDISTLGLTTRPANCLGQNNIATIGDLIQFTEWELLRLPNLGRKSLKEINEALAVLGLRLGMSFEDCPEKLIAPAYTSNAWFAAAHV